MDPLVFRVAARFAETKRLDLAWVEGLRKDFLTLLKNLPRVHDYKTAHQLREAFTHYREHFNELFFERFLNRDLKYYMGIGESDAAYIDRMIRSIAWSFSIELAVPIGFADDYYNEESRFAAFQREFPKWKTRVQRKAQDFWKEMKHVIEVFDQHYKKPIDVSVPTVETTRLEGFSVVMRSYDPNEETNREELEALKAGLSIYRQRASQVMPILLQKQLPIVVEFEVKLDKGGEYNGREVIFYASSVMNKGPKWVVHTLAHEMGHHLFKTYLSSEAAHFWTDTIRGDFGDLDIKELLDKWPGDTWAYQFPEIMGKEDPVLALQVDAVSHDPEFRKSLQSKEDFQKLYDEGTRTLKVPKHPITGYANKNPEEAFCETVGLLVAYGPRAVDDRVKWWLKTVVPGAVKLASLPEE